MRRVKLGQYIVTDPDICHGKPTFAGTRIMVEQVLQMVAEGTEWEQIVAEYDGAIRREAIAGPFGWQAGHSERKIQRGALVEHP